MLKLIPGYKNKYAASDDGRIWSYANRMHQGIWLKPYLSNGYELIRFPGRTALVHRLIAITFLPNSNNYPQVNHRNGIKTDNRVENLEWVTSSQNKQHSHHVLKNGIGESAGNPKLTEAKVREIRQAYVGKHGQQTALAKQYGVSQARIGKIVNNEAWVHLGAV